MKIASGFLGRRRHALWRVYAIAAATKIARGCEFR